LTGKLSQTITFGSISAVTYGASPITLTASSDSGLSVAFTTASSSVCSISGSTVTILGGGACVINANQAGNSTYAAASQVSQTLTVNKKSQTITFNAISDLTFGASSFALTPSSDSGLAVTLSTLSTGICSVSGLSVTVVGGGRCVLQANQSGNSNYSAASQVTQSFLISPTSQTITFTSPTTKTYGDAAFNLVASSSSGLTVSLTSSPANNLHGFWKYLDHRRGWLLQGDRKPEWFSELLGSYLGRKYFYYFQSYADHYLSKLDR